MEILWKFDIRIVHPGAPWPLQEQLLIFNELTGSQMGSMEPALPSDFGATACASMFSIFTASLTGKIVPSVRLSEFVSFWNNCKTRTNRTAIDLKQAINHQQTFLFSPFITEDIEEHLQTSGLWHQP